MLDLLITPALADAGAPPAGGGMSMFFIFGIFILFMYFAVWRPQSKRAKEQRSMLDSLAKDDEVVTVGGILGKVSKLSEQYLVLALDDQVSVTVQKASIASVLPKGTLKSLMNG
jgi:preprotein translocase subunit YajC